MTLENTNKVKIEGKMSPSFETAVGGKDMHYPHSYLIFVQRRL
jgi:hypothetical protein